MEDSISLDKQEKLMFKKEKKRWVTEVRRERRRPKFVAGSGRGWARLEVSKSGQLSARESAANNSFPAFKSDTLHPHVASSISPRHDWNTCTRLVTTLIKIVYRRLLLHSSFFFWTKEVTSMETFNARYLNITDASSAG